MFSCQIRSTSVRHLPCYVAEIIHLTVARLQVVLDVSVEVATQAACSAHKLRTEFYVNGATVSLPGQREALRLRHQHVLGDLLQLQVMDVMRQLQTTHREQNPS